MPKRAVQEQAPVGPKRWVDVELGDAEVTVEEFPDGMFVVHVTGGEEPLVVNVDQMRLIVRAFIRMTQEKGWLE